MSTKKLFAILLSLVLLITVLPLAVQAEEGLDGNNFLFVNHFGQELHLDLDDTPYVIPGKATAPEGGRLTLQLEPGEHKFAANVPGVSKGWAGEFTIEPGGYVAKAARMEMTDPVVEDGILLQKPKEYVYVYDFNPFAESVQPQAVMDTWQPAPPPASKGSLVWINHSGQDEVTVDLNGQVYKVPPKTNDIPGRLQVDVDPGTYQYSASIPSNALSGEVTVTAGEVIGLSVIPGSREEPKYDVGDEFEIPPVPLSLDQQNLTDQVQQQPAATTPMQEEDQAPMDLPTTGETMGAEGKGLLIKNYAGDTLVFTINGETYTILNNEQKQLQLPPGEYSYTASLPFVATTGTVNLTSPTDAIELSVAATPGQEALNVYKN